MNTNKPFTIFSASALICALGLSTSWAEVTNDEAVTKIQALAQKVEGADAREKLVFAYETLTKAGVSADKSLALIETAVKREVPAETLIREAREIQSAAKDDRANADKYANETMSQFSQQEFSETRVEGHDLAHEVHDMRGMGENPGGMDTSGAGGGFGGSDVGAGGGAGSGFGGSDVGAGTGGGAGTGVDMGTVSGGRDR